MKHFPNLLHLFHTSIREKFGKGTPLEGDWTNPLYVFHSSLLSTASGFLLSSQLKRTLTGYSMLRLTEKHFSLELGRMDEGDFRLGSSAAALQGYKCTGVDLEHLTTSSNVVENALSYKGRMLSLNHSTLLQIWTIIYIYGFFFLMCHCRFGPCNTDCNLDLRLIFISAPKQRRSLKQTTLEITGCSGAERNTCDWVPGSWKINIGANGVETDRMSSYTCTPVWLFP